jgi:Mn-dependent DtxR family transcriptional regulator
MGPWTRPTLELIAKNPGTRAADLAPQLQQERLPFKANVRKLKELGLTISLERGYELSPRGRAYREKSARRR